MFYLVFVTAKDRAEAKRISEKLVRERLAACVNIVPRVNSTYIWRGKTERSTEALLLVKTSDRKLGSLIARVEKLHSYDVPEVIALPIGRGSLKYMRWLKESLG